MLWLLLACPGAFDTGDSFFTGLVCGSWLSESVPAQGAEDVWWTDPVIFTMAGVPSGVTMRTNFGGGTTTIDGSVVTFVPDVPFPPASTVVATIEGCGSQLSVSFATAASGLPVDAAALPGHSWSLAREESDTLDALRVIDRMYGVAWPLLGVAGTADLPTVTMFAPSSSGESCDGWTGTYDATWVTDSTVEVTGIDTLRVMVDGTHPVPIHLTHLYFGFTPDADALEGSHVVGWIDAREVAAIESLGVTSHDIFELWQSFGVGPLACEDGSSLCAEVRVSDLVSEDTDPSVIEAAAGTCG